MRVTCPNCGGNHPKWDCKSVAKKSTERKKMAAPNAVAPAVKLNPATLGAGAKQAVDTKPKRGRPISDTPKSPRAEYMRELMRKRRADEKAKSAPKD